MNTTSHWPRLPLIAVVVLAWGVVGCSQDETRSAQLAAKAATPSPQPSPFAQRSRLLIESLAARSTPVPGSADMSAEDDEDGGPISLSADADPNVGGAPLTVTFTAEVNGPPNLHYRWDFGDNTPPARQLSVQHTYQQPGDYTAIFTAIGFGSVEETQELNIQVTDEAFDLDINADPDIGTAPLAVEFSAVLDEDLPGPFYFQWTFGDGGRDVSNPTTHTYRLAGEYTATVTVTNPEGQMAKREVPIQVDPRDEDSD